MVAFDEIMDTIFSGVRTGVFPESFQMAAARVIEERDIPNVRTWLENVGQGEILSVVESISAKGTAYQDGAVSDAITKFKANHMVATPKGWGQK